MFAQNVLGCRRLCKAVSRLSNPRRLHSPSLGTPSLNKGDMVIWDVRHEYNWSYQSPSSKEHRFILAITDYFSKWAESIPSGISKPQMFSNSLNSMSFIASAFCDELSMTTCPNSSVKHFRSYGAIIRSKVCHQPNTICLPMALQKLSIRQLGSSEEVCLSEPMRLGWLAQQMSMDILYNGQGLDKSHPILSGIRLWSRPPIRDPDPIPQSCFDNQNVGWRKS